MKLSIPHTVASLQDVQSLERELHEYSTWYAHESIKKRLDAKHGTPMPILSPSALELLRTWHGTQTLTEKTLEALVQALANYREHAQTITLTLAAPVTHAVKAQLVQWCRENISPDILISFQFNQTLLGGMVVRFGSRVFDWSFRRQILAARDQFPEVLSRV